MGAGDIAQQRALTCPAHAGLRKDGQEKKTQLRFKQGLLVTPVEASYHFLREEHKPRQKPMHGTFLIVS